jgi:hypothetical protein
MLQMSAGKSLPGIDFAIAAIFQIGITSYSLKQTNFVHHTF